MTVDVKVYAYFDLSGASDILILDDPVKGELDSAYELAGDIKTDISSYVQSFSMERGRARQLDEIDVGTLEVVVNNHARAFDPEYLGEPTYDAYGAVVTDVDGNPVIATPAPFYGNLDGGKRIDVEVNGTAVYVGEIDDLDFTYQPSGDSLAILKCVDTLAVLGAAEFDEWTTTAGNLPGARLTAVLDRSEVAFPANRNIDTGTSTLVADLVSWGSNVLNYCQLVSRSDLGWLFASRSNVLTFRGRRSNPNQAASAVFSDTGSNIPYVSIELQRGREFLYTRVACDSPTLTVQTASNATAMTRYGVRTLPISGLLQDSEAQLLAMAEYLLAAYSGQRSRITEVTVILEALTDAQVAVIAALDITDVVQVTFTPNGTGLPIDTYAVVEGVAIEAMPAQTQVTIRLGDVFERSAFVLDDAVFGVLDGPGRLVF